MKRKKKNGHNENDILVNNKGGKSEREANEQREQEQ